MQAVILAAGRGTRLGDLTKDIPKPLIPVNGKPIVQYTLEMLPVEIDEVIFVVNYLSDKIRNYFGDNFQGRSVRYVEQGEMSGTAGALWAVRPLLSAGKFLIMSGDNICSPEDIAGLLRYDLVLGVHRVVAPSSSYHNIALDQTENVKDFKSSLPGQEILLAAGMYVLDQRIFKYQPVLRSSGEFSLPHTILKLAVDYPVKGVIIKHWLSGNTPEDLAKIGKYLK